MDQERSRWYASLSYVFGVTALTTILVLSAWPDDLLQLTVVVVGVIILVAGLLWLWDMVMK